MAGHDLSYKHLFSHHEMVRDLLEGFVCPDWTAQLNLHSPGKDNASYVSDSLHARHGDIVWEVPLIDSDASLQVLLEFQSTVDASMAVRMLSYVSLRYQDLLKSGRIRPDRPLPPVLPLVLYNGRSPWNVAESTAELLNRTLPGLEPFQPAMRYFLIDIARYPHGELVRKRNLVAVMFRLENSRTSQDVDDVTTELHQWWESAAQASLRRAFIKWLDRVIIPRHLRESSALAHNFEEKSMSLAEAVEDWRAKYRGEGLVRGRREGLREGLREGRLEGQLEGERQMLERLLRRRFGDLPPEITQRLHQAQTVELEHWAERLLDARSLAELFEEKVVEA